MAREMITTVLALVSRHKLKDGRRFGELSLRSITPGAADRIHEQLLVTGNKHRQRTAKLAMDVCRRAWGIAYRSFPTIVPAQNPFSKMGLSYKPLKTRAATFEELNSFVAKADELGYRSLGTAARSSPSGGCSARKTFFSGSAGLTTARLMSRTPSEFSITRRANQSMYRFTTRTGLNSGRTWGVGSIANRAWAHCS